jgi:hypothetical protein
MDFLKSYLSGKATPEQIQQLDKLNKLLKRNPLILLPFKQQCIYIDFLLLPNIHLILLF